MTKHLHARERIYSDLLTLYHPFMLHMQATEPGFLFAKLLQSRYGFDETKHMTLEQLDDLAKFMRAQIGTTP